jgi:hypothetical protein
MWDSENERLGVQACSSSAYLLRGISVTIGRIGFYLFLIASLYILYKLFSLTYSNHLLLWVIFPISIGIISEIIFYLAIKELKKLTYTFNPSTGITKWIKDKQTKTYIFQKYNELEDIE